VAAVSIVMKLLMNPAKRLRSNSSVDMVQQHPFFKGIDWQALQEKRVKPPEKVKKTEEDNHRFRKVLKDDNTSCIINQEVFALKLVRNKLMSKVEKEFLLQALGHPFLVQLLAYFQTKESFCDVTEYCKGGTLHSLMSRLKRFHEDLARFYVAEIILAVNFLQKCGIIHRDTKPGNIFLDKDGQLKLPDFGLSQVGTFK